VDCQGDIPCGRIGHTLVTNADETTVYLYGGVHDSKEQISIYLHDFYRFDFLRKTWTFVEMTGEIQMARAFHSAVCYENSIYIFGGCNGRGRFNKLFSISPDGVCALVVPPSGTDIPATRYCHSAVVFEEKMYVFAGKCGGRNSNRRLQDLWAFHFQSKCWEACEQLGDIPPSRSAHATFTCGRRMVMFGGRSSEGECCEDLYHYNFDNHMWTRIDTSLGPLFGRARHSVVVHNGKVVIFGGWNGKKKLNDLIYFNVDSETSEVVLEHDDCCPSRRECHVAVTCKNTMVVFGGRFRGTFMNDTCELDLEPKSLKDCCRDWILQHHLDLEVPQLPRRLKDYILKWRVLNAEVKRDEPPHLRLSSATSPEPTRLLPPPVHHYQ
jgi:hypothetical protein